jgi:predicted dehydrogenase
MPEDLRIGIIGCGNRVSGMARNLARLDQACRVAAVADPRADELRARRNPLLSGAAFFKTANELLSADRYDGIMIGTRCSLHTEMARKVGPTGTPLFLEKPVATTFDQVKALAAAAPTFTAPVVVSFPLRVSPIVERVKEIIASGRLGTIEHVVAVNDVPYGEGYYAGWYRDYAEAGGLFLQKATHDFDYLSHLVEQPVRWVCAMKSQRVFGGRADKPFELYCKDCGEKGTCSESPFNTQGMLSPHGRKAWKDWRKCLFSAAIRNEDSGNAILEFANGVQASYTQNFFARRGAARRGARLYGYRGTIEFDWYTNRITVYPHARGRVETIRMAGDDAHFGGDDVLCQEFAGAMRRKAASRAPLAAGIHSALTCLWARESADRRVFCEVRLP